MPRQNYAILDSFGLEIETEGIIRGSLPREFRAYFSEDHDASIETPVFKDPEIDDIYFIENNDNQNLLPITVGDELVSRVLDINDPEVPKILGRLTEWLYENGESEESFRAGTHIHICMPYNLAILQNFVRLVKFSEQIFYYIGGQGYQFRGTLNDFTYCRPMTSFGPSVIHTTPPIQAFNLNNMERAKTLEHFFDSYGMNYNNPPGKYNPSRYNWFTFYPLLTKGTVELRVLNKSLNPGYIMAAVHLFRAFCARAINTVPELPTNSIYDEHNKDKVTYDLGLLLDLLGFDNNKVVRTLFNIIKRTPDIVINKEYIYTHLRPGRYSTYVPNYSKVETLEFKEIKNPNFVDIHTLGR